MNGDAGYALQKLELAITDMATGPGDIKSRLKDAYTDHLHVINEKDFPNSLKPYWGEIKKQLTRKESVRDEVGERYIGSVSNTLHGMHKKTGTKIAKNILLLSDRLRGYLDDLANKP
jgi:hypothetical protein